MVGRIIQSLAVISLGHMIGPGTNNIRWLMENEVGNKRGGRKGSTVNGCIVFCGKREAAFPGHAVTRRTTLDSAPSRRLDAL